MVCALHASSHKCPHIYLNRCLQDAKLEKNCCVAFLDISKAYDNIGHEHLKRSLYHVDMPNNLRDLIINLMEDNIIKIETGLNKSGDIHLNKGVAQDSPLSLVLFNLAIDNILKELTEPEIAQEYGYHLSPTVSPVSILAFADDLALISKDLESVPILTDLTIQNLLKIGLNINPKNVVSLTLKMAWTIRAADDKRLTVAEMRFMRQLAGCSLLEDRKNEDILKELKIDPLVHFVQQYRLQWKKHVERMNHIKWPRQILAYVPRGRRNLGRPRKRWHETITDPLGSNT
ncbi:hypothetical protein ANN_00769 [Periplaneta americana]|uniref:Reverse transcriptase domain-containing protein n=1 Tax=Periplaneta americana TaxID=6978 RepID=A0ABQ8TU43_PERAM|nr:hypothetical protein ANN_00769 [Periplaneta americana]